jgi:DNA-binding transcriptional LysR family regulator
MYHDQLNGLLALKAVAGTLNFSAAAKTLGISPSAVSQTIKQLEQRLGIALLSRTTRSTSLTEAGERFLAQAGPALDQILAALQSVGTYAEKPSGLLRLNLPRQVYPFYLAPLVASFTDKYPEITVELFFEDQQADVVGEGFDAGIRVSDILAKDVVAIKLFGPVRFVTAASPAYLEKMGRPKHPEDLLSHNCIRARLGTGLYERWEFQHKGKEFQVQVRGSLIINDSLLTLNAAADGAGIVYSTEDAISSAVQSGNLEIVLSQFSCASAGFYLYYPKRSQVLPKLRAFIEHIRIENKLASRDAIRRLPLQDAGKASS